MKSSKFIQAVSAILCVALVMTLSAFIAPPVNAATAKTGTINSQDVNMRDKASTTSNIIMKISQGVSVSVLASESGGWYKIKYQGKTGYVRQDYVDVEVTGLNNAAIVTKDSTLYKKYDTGSTVVTQVTAKTDATVTGTYGDWYQVKVGSKSGWMPKTGVHQYVISTLNVTATVNSDGVNLRKTPNTTADVVAQMKKGTTLTAYKLQDNWLYVSDTGKKGYVRADYVTYKIPSNYYFIPLSPGMKSQDVTNLQDALKSKGFFSGAANGSYGSATKAAVARFQASVKLKADGVAGSQTQLLLYGSKGAAKVGSNYRSSMPAQKPQKNGIVLLDDWFGYMENTVKKYSPFEVIDVRTGIHWNMQRFGGWWHADVEPMTKADTEAMTKAWGGTLNPSRRPVWVKISGRYYAASLMGYVHNNGTIDSNGMPGQVCLHFRGSKIHESGHVDEAHQACIIEAFNSATKLSELIKAKKV